MRQVKKKEHSTVLNLAALRRLFGQRRPTEDLLSVEGRVGPGRWRKVYGLARKDRWIYRATNYKLKGKLRPLNQIAKGVDKRTLIELFDERDALMNQLCVRAACGDRRALSLMLSTARGVITALDTLERIPRAKLVSHAETSSNWPVLLSLNPQDVKHAKDKLQRLRVGTKATTPRLPRQRLDPRNFWTALAAKALEICESNKIFVPELKRFAAEAKRTRKNVKFWKTPVSATYFEVSESDCIIITGWEDRCARLSKPIRQANFKQWWSVVQPCVLELWSGSKEEYEAALKQISDRTAPKEFQKRNLALAQLRKSFRSLVGLR